MSAHNTIHRLTLTALATFAVLASGLVLAVTQSAAFVGYSNTPNSVFGEPGSGNGQFSEPTAVAVDDSSGDVYVVDRGNGHVDKFSAEGAYISQFNGSETPAGSFQPTDVAIDNSTDAAKGDVYVVDEGHNVIDVFGSNGNYLSQIVGPPFSSEVSVATEGSNVWVSEANGDVYEFSDTGSFLGQFDTGHRIRAVGGIAVDSSSNVYVLSHEPEYVRKYSSTGTYLAGWDNSSEPAAIAVNESTNDVFLDRVTEIEESGPFGEPYGSPIEEFGSGSIPVFFGVAVNDTTGTLYASEYTGRVAVFKSGLLLPDVSTGAGKVKRVIATLEGVVNPNGEEVTSCQFEYGTSTSYGQTAPCSTAAGSGSSPVPIISAELSALAQDTTYHYRLVAGNANGTHAGADATFTTQSIVEGLATAPATEVLGTSATLNGSLEPNGLDTHYWFEYGPSPSYGSSTPHEDAGEASAVKLVSATLTGIEPNRTYYYRLVGENSVGVTYGAEETLTTNAIVPVAGAASLVSSTRTEATLTGTLNPQNSETTYEFVFGETSNYGEHTYSVNAGSGLGEEHVEAIGLTGLTPSTTYHYALRASNQAGTVTGPDGTFTTAPASPPGVTTGGASNITLTSATVAATIEAQGLETSYALELGPDTSYGTSIYGEAGYAVEPVGVSVELQDLDPGTTYHYRFVAINSEGRVYGADQTFTTPPYSSPIMQPPTVPLLAVPAIAFPAEEPTTTAKSKPLTKAQKLAKALQACRKGKRSKRAGCEQRARKRNGSPASKKRGRRR